MLKEDICKACREEVALHEGAICDCERCEVDDIDIPDSVAMSIRVVGFDTHRDSSIACDSCRYKDWIVEYGAACRECMRSEWK